MADPSPDRPPDLPPAVSWYPLPLGVASLLPPPARRVSGALLLDRDGTLILDDHYLDDPERVRLVPEAVEAMRRARSRDWAVGIVSNQGGIGLGRFGWDRLAVVQRALEAALATEGLAPDLCLVCPYHPDAVHPHWRGDAPKVRGRKPGPGMIELARELLSLREAPVEHTILVVGDKESDVAAGLAAGAEVVRVPRRTWDDSHPEARAAEPGPTRGGPPGGWPEVMRRLGSDRRTPTSAQPSPAPDRTEELR